MGNRWMPREFDPICRLDSSETEVLSLPEERRLLAELERCKAKLARPLSRTPNYEGVPEDGDDDSDAMARRMILVEPEDKSLGATYRRLLEVRARLALSNMKLVAHMARKFRDRGIAHSDLIQEGFHGLLEAIDRFDTGHGTKLATYATWWIRQAMQQAVAAGAYPVRLSPRHLRQLAKSQETAPPQARANVETEDALNGELINRIQAATRPSVSLNRSLDSDSGFDLLQVLGDAEKGLDAVDAGETINRLLEVLRPREREVLSFRFGLGGAEQMSLSQVGVKLKVSKERIRQIQDRAIEKLRSAAIEQNLESEFAPSD